MSVLSYACVVGSYFLYSTIGFPLNICDKGERDNEWVSVLDQVLCVCVCHDLFIAPACTALATSCQVYPSEYAYEHDSVTRTESVNANCRNYPPGNLLNGVDSQDYTHCDGTQLKLTDSNFGQEQYQPTDYYVWSSSSSGKQLLFIFPTRVSLTTITLHHYSESDWGLPRLRFYAVPDNFDVWDAPTTIYPSVNVASFPPGGEPAGRRSASINVNLNTKRVLMYKYRSSFQLAVGEVEFFTCTCSEWPCYSYIQCIT